MIDQYAETASQRDANHYIPLFSQFHQEEMKHYYADHGADGFFSGAEIEITNKKKLSASVGEQAACLSWKEKETFADISVYYVEMRIKNGVVANEETLNNGYTHRVFVFVKEEEQWKIYRISTPNFAPILAAGEGFQTENEQQEVAAQNCEKTLG